MSNPDLEEARALDARLTTIRRGHRRAEHQLAVLLAEMYEQHHYRTLGYATLEQNAGPGRRGGRRRGRRGLSGEPSQREPSVSRPILKKNWKKPQEVHGGK